MQEEKVLLNATLCFLVKGEEILLALKADKIGQGCWNGYGGGIERGETPIQSAIRELREEARIEAVQQDLDKVAIIDFHNIRNHKNRFTCKVHVYFVRDWQGEAQATAEMEKPTWFNKNSLPLETMMIADKYWLPIALKGKKMVAEFCYGPFQKTLLGEIKINLVESFPHD